MSVWSVEAVAGLIELYRSHPPLWKTKSKEYMNKNLRNIAYDELVDYCKSVGFENANRDFVTKKIQSLRGAFRKELNKVTYTSKKSGNGEEDVYKPSLWYYDLLLFTKDMETPANSISNMETENANFQDENVPPSPTERYADVSASSIPHSCEVASTGGKPALKRKTLVDRQLEFMNACSDAIKKKPMSEYEAAAVNISRKLEKMDNLQAIYAESLINKILRKGLLNELKQRTDICDKQCNTIVQYSAPNPGPREPTYYSEEYIPVAREEIQEFQDVQQDQMKEFYENYNKI